MDKKTTPEAFSGAQSEPNNINAAPKVKKRHTGRIILIIILVLLFIGIIIALIKSGAGSSNNNYIEYTAATGNISNSLSFSGTLQAINNKTYTASSEASVREIYVAEGDMVNNGDYIMHLSNGQLIKAEFQGKVDTVSVKKDEHVASGAELCKIVDFKHQKVSFHVDEYDIDSIQVGDSCRITTAANERTFDSVISSISHIPSSTGEVAFYTAIAYIDADDGVYPGMQVTVTVPKNELHDVVVLKVSAISFDESNRALVYIKDKNGKMLPTYVTPGISNGNYVEIKDGVKSGDIVYAVEKKDKKDSSPSATPTIKKPSSTPTPQPTNSSNGGGK